MKTVKKTIEQIKAGDKVQNKTLGIGTVNATPKQGDKGITVSYYGANGEIVSQRRYTLSEIKNLKFMAAVLA